MKAIGIEKFGTLNNLKILEIPEPTPTKGRLIVAVQAFSLNPYDLKIIDGSQLAVRPLSLPLIPGSDVAGIVIDKDSSVTDFNIGDRVVGRSNLGGYAEIASVPHLRAAKIPDNVSFETAASIPNAGVTAFDIVNGALSKAKFNSVLINGVSGAVGIIAAQLLRENGKLVSGVLHSTNKHLQSDLNLSETAFYDIPQSLDKLGKFDLIINTAPDTNKINYLNTHLSLNGTILSTTGISQLSSATELIDFDDTKYKMNRQALESLLSMISNNRLKIPIANQSSFNVLSVINDLKQLEVAHKPGKFIVTI
ncbi:NADP-dependent oxidoreductase [Pediococcus claussenii]|uniref:Alcohol dehydrogenase GroES-like domain protein n=1 Tax=Pediococcus claussenii (strain ATCC BAA-344 / DSM 14800 / JCM 18046 / KCTC 3811 / LMG 21948 / P06) TaxID=701521 RepID=G8PDQ8_PEDCP|nr:NADP-dependent oxidoreductase [Pediococcus claussenii]AEV95393.1 alcohol dehydrogenase GroES-like domain protein [Pediococcus claussenii ATCC BAA-344]ANZ68924.1 hypothetical protein AYR57_00675 [Pediococcus claussenii]ANZ70740.1 hypothetical protein AYR58_00675 [Pediococcus claussenii]KRN19036.1 hypothetical protein IV79_GL001698 [Pediococcus claussenii]